MTQAAISAHFAYENQRVKGIEPSCVAWEATVLPLNYTRAEIFDFRISIADCNKIVPAGDLVPRARENRSLPRNYIIGRIEVCALGLIFPKRPRNHAHG